MMKTKLLPEVQQSALPGFNVIPIVCQELARAVSRTWDRVSTFPMPPHERFDGRAHKDQCLVRSVDGRVWLVQLDQVPSPLELRLMTPVMFKVIDMEG